MQVSGKLHALAALLSEIEPRAPVVQEAGWAPEPVWTLWKTEKSPPLVGNGTLISRVTVKSRKIQLET
jgi:hypothetical protein